jgi:hypothetical protein
MGEVDSPDYAALVDLPSPAAERGEKTSLKQKTPAEPGFLYSIK